MKKYINLTLCFFLLIFITLPSFAILTPYVWSNNNETFLTNANIDTNKTELSSNTLKLESPSAILIEQTTGKILYEHNPHEKLFPASVTKVMTMLIIMEHISDGKISFSDSIPCSETARSMGGSQIWLDTTETLTVDEMLKAICVVSAND